MPDVVVVGSGAAGVAAAVGAAQRGARVTILETAERAGGTTCLSGGLAWTPGNPDDPGTAQDALRYLEELDLGDRDAELCDTYVREAPGVTAELARVSPLGWHSVPYPDYHAEFPGGVEGGRAIEPDPVKLPEEIVSRVREAPNITAPITYRELATGEWDRAEIARRREEGVITLGRALISSLLAAALERGAELRTGTRARGLLRDNGAVRGVRTDDGDVQGRVVLASGGFERDPELVRSFLRGPMSAPAGVPTNVGDGLRMAIGAGCALGNLSEAWWSPAIRVPGETIDGEPMYRVVLTERARPGSLIVDGRGRRFTDEAQNYNDIGRSLHDFDPAAFSFPRVPAWMVFDGAHRARYNLGPLRRSAPDPAWLRRAEDLPSLAEAIGVPPEELVATVERFNELVAAGRDADFGRGDYVYDRFLGDPQAANPVLGAIGEPPFYALEILPGCLGTKGGPRTDDRGRALHVETVAPIGGLYAAGNAAASPFGFAYPGPGSTIGPALVFGHRAGEAAAEDR